MLDSNWIRYQENVRGCIYMFYPVPNAIMYIDDLGILIYRVDRAPTHGSLKLLN